MKSILRFSPVLWLGFRLLRVVVGELLVQGSLRQGGNPLCSLNHTCAIVHDHIKHLSTHLVRHQVHRSHERSHVSLCLVPQSSDRGHEKVFFHDFGSSYVITSYG